MGRSSHVDPYAQDNNRDPRPIKAFGRYAHEALVIDPRRGTVYLTEDAGNPNGLLYRWTPPRTSCRWPRLAAQAPRRRRPRCTR